MKILSRMLSKKIDPEMTGGPGMEDEEQGFAPRADDTGRFNPSRSPLAEEADLSQPIRAKDEEPEVAGSGWGNSEWDDDDWDDDEDWGEEDLDSEMRRRTADKKQLVSEIRDAMISVSQARPESRTPSRPAAEAESGWSDDEEFGRRAKARSELINPGNEDRILEKTENAMSEEGTSRRRSAMAHLKAAAAATKADRVLRHVVSRDPSADPEEQSPYRDDLAKVVRPHSTSRPISRVASRTETRSPIWDQGEGDEDAALYAAAEDEFMDDGSVQDELTAAEAERMARSPADLSAEDFANDYEDQSASARVRSAFPSSRFAQDDGDVEEAPENAFDDAASAFEEVEPQADFDDQPEDFDDDFADEDDDFAPRPSTAVAEAIAFANATDEELESMEDDMEPEGEVRKKIWEMADEVAAELGQQTENQTAENFAEVATAVSGRAGRSAGRVKTRLLGFQAEDEPAKDVFQEATGKVENAAAGMHFPAGWIVVIDGPGRGASFTLQVGVSQIGRGEEQAVRLDFGDTSISRNNHAAVAYDDEQGKFFLGHGGKSNLVRLNGMPVLSTEEMSDGDEIRIGETTLKFVALCGEAFTWTSKDVTAAE